MSCYMQKLCSLSICIILVLSLSIWLISAKSHAQLQPTSNSTSINAPTNGNNGVSVSSSVTLHVTNQTFKSNQGTLRSAVLDILNSGPSILKTLDGNQLIIKTKFNNQINNATQIVEGLEATNAIIGVELGKALTSIISSVKNQNQSGIVSVQTSSTCKAAPAISISCENNIVIK